MSIEKLDSKYVCRADDETGNAVVDCMDKINEIIDVVNTLTDKRKEPAPDECGEIIQHTIMGPIWCANKKPCSMHQVA